MEPIWAVGLMTGTVLDGNIDVAVLRGSLREAGRICRLGGDQENNHEIKCAHWIV